MDKRQIEKTVNEYIGHAEEIGEGIDTYLRFKEAFATKKERKEVTK